MNLLSYKYNDNIWDFQEITLGKVNLIVGDSATGKTRFLNTIKNFTDQVVSEKLQFPGHWNIKFTIKDKIFEWDIVIEKDTTNNESNIIKEKIILQKNKKQQEDRVIIFRDTDSFSFNGVKLPKLSKNVASIYLLKDEEDIAEIYNSFRTIVIRRFFTDELKTNFSFVSIMENKFEQLKKEKLLDKLIREEIGFSNKILLLKEINKKKYDELLKFYKEVFPFIEDFDITKASKLNYNLPFNIDVAAFCFKEKNINNWISVTDISSGMQKIFLLALDIFLMPEGGIILIDEYENSLGINALNIFPDLIYDTNINCQYIISSHHPYIINRVPIEDWLVFNRKGTFVRIKSGKELKDKYAKSNQQNFIKLINDPFYTEGIE